MLVHERTASKPVDARNYTYIYISNCASTVGRQVQIEKAEKNCMNRYKIVT